MGSPIHPIVRIFSFFFGFVALGCLAVILRDLADGTVAKKPGSFLASLGLTIFMVYRSLKKKSLSLSGAYAAFIVGFLHMYSHRAFGAALLAFFVSSSAVTRYRQEIKRKVEGSAFKYGGQRNWIQVLCNGFAGSICALAYLIVYPSEVDIQFTSHPYFSYLPIAILGANASCNGDTWASEIGMVLCQKDPYLITTGKPVPKGTNGGVSLIGCVVSLLGGLFVGLIFFIIIITDERTSLSIMTCSSFIFLGAIGGLLGSIIDSLLGATLQYTGLNDEGSIVERPEASIKHISGLPILDNHSVNLLSSLLTALILPSIASLIL